MSSEQRSDHGSGTPVAATVDARVDARVAVTWTPYGRPATAALRDAVRTVKGDEPLAPVTVVVPANQVGVASRRALASGAHGPVCGSGTGLAGVTFVTPYRLAELLGAPSLAASGRRPVSAPVLTTVVRAVLAEHPGRFTPVADHPATEAALVDAYRELRDCSEEALGALSGHGPRGREVVRVARAMRARLASEWSDEEDLMTAATEVAEAGGPGVADLGEVVVHLPQRLSRHAVGLLSALAGQVSVTVVAGTCGDRDADGEVVASVKALGGSDPPTGAPHPPPLPTDGTTVVTTSDADEEVRDAVRRVMAAVKAGTTFDRIAVLHPGTDPYPRQLHEQLGAAGVPVNGQAVDPVVDRIAGRCLLGLLELGDGGYRRRDVFAWLHDVPVLRSHGAPVPLGAWERGSREAGVVAGRGDWEARLAHRADTLEARAEATEKEAGGDDDDGGAAQRAERHRQQAAQARELSSFVLGLIDEVAEARSGPRGWADHARWAKKLLRRLLGSPDHWTNRAGDEALAAEQRAFTRTELAIDRLGALADIEPDPIDLAVFNHTLRVELESDLGRIGRLGDGVFVGSVAMGLGLELDLVIVLGLAEGTYPTSPGDDPLLPDCLREATGAELSRNPVPRAHRDLRAAIAGASSVVLSMPRGDLRRSSDRVPSRWLLDAASSLAGDRLYPRDLLERPWPWKHDVASHADGLAGVEDPATEQEHRLVSLLAGSPGRAHAERALAHPETDAIVRSGAHVLTERRSNRFTAFDGRVSAELVPSPVDHPTSTTALERWAGCPFAYLVRHILGVQEVENPEDSIRVTPLNRGSLIHQVLERFIRAAIDRGAPEPTRHWTTEDHALLDDIINDVFADFEARGLTGRAVYWSHDRGVLRSELHEALNADNTHRAGTQARPIAAELAFGPESDLAPVTVGLADGRSLPFGGKADRVDETDTGGLVVIDYKTGKDDDYRNLSENDPVLAGTRLQLPIYALAARAISSGGDTGVRSEYRFTSHRAKEPTIGYPVTEEVLELTSSVLTSMISGIEAGVFISRPPASGKPWVQCSFCDPDGLGTAAGRAAWLRKCRATELRAYAELAEPESLEVGDD